MKKILIATSAITLLILAGCFLTPGDLITDTDSIAMDTIDSLYTILDIGVGELNISGGSADIMEAEFTYNIKRWEPVVEYDNNNDYGRLNITQPETDNFITFGTGTNRWDLFFNDSIATYMTINSGTAEMDLLLSTLALKGLKIDGGTGNIYADLNGDWDYDLDVTVESGTGNIELDLPAAMGISVVINTGTGTISANGFTMAGTKYVNDLFSTAENTMTIIIETGTGNITLNLVD